MSFINVRKKSAHPQRKRVSRKQQPWDDTITDLTAYKATPDEIEYRKSSHKSKHAVCTHINRGQTYKGKSASPFKNNAQARKMAIMKEVLYDQRQLQDILEKSDTMMAVVKDLFGDDPRRFAGLPEVTRAPNMDSSDVAASLIKLPPDVRTRSELLSESMMDGSALNDLQTSESEEESPQQPLQYQTKMNMQRFQQFLESEEKNNTLSTISGQAGLSYLGQALTSQLAGQVHSSQLPDQTNLSKLTSKNGTFQTPPKNNPNESIEILRPPKSAINNTDKVNKTKRCVPRPEPVDRSANFSLQDLRKVLEGLEDEIADYERQTGRRPPAERQRQESFSGYTLALVDSVTKLTRYLKECDIRLQAEMTVREQLSQDVVQCKALIDALTSDIITTQEEFHTMAFEFQRYKTHTQQEIHKLKGGQVEEVPERQTRQPTNPAESVQSDTPPKLQPPDTETSESGLPRPVPFGDHMKPVSAAVMLSPPVRRSRVAEAEREEGNKRQGSLLNFPDVSLSVDGTNSSIQDEYAALPDMYTTSQAGLIDSYGAALQSTDLQRPPQQAVQQQSDQMASQDQPASLGVTQRRPAGPVPLNSVSVPRPTPLVQTNVQIQPQQDPVRRQAMDSQHAPITVTAHDNPKPLQSIKPQAEPSSSGPDREFLASQIAELNKQHAEAQMRLQGLMNRQNLPNPQQEEQIKQQQQQQQQQRQEVVDNQNRIQQHQLQQQQQQRLIEMVLQQQHKIQQQQRLQKQLVDHRSQGQGHRAEGQGQPEVNGGVAGVPDVRESVEIPGYRPHPHHKQPGLPGYQISPNISPISQRSESFRPLVYQSVDSQDTSISAPANRGITVSLPKVDMDLSGETSSPQNIPQTAR